MHLVFRQRLPYPSIHADLLGQPDLVHRYLLVRSHQLVRLPLVCLLLLLYQQRRQPPPDLSGPVLWPRLDRPPRLPPWWRQTRADRSDLCRPRRRAGGPGDARCTGWTSRTSTKRTDTSGWTGLADGTRLAGTARHTSGTG